VVGSGDTLANGGEVDAGAGGSKGKWELGDGVEGNRILASAMKFALEVELDYFHIAQGHADVFVPQHLHERRQADAEAHHLSREGVPQPVRVDLASATRSPRHFN